MSDWELEYIFCCPCCGRVTHGFENNGEIKPCGTCGCLSPINTKIEVTLDDFSRYFGAPNMKLYKAGLWDKVSKDAREQYCLHSPQFDQAAWDAREAKEQRNADIASGKVKLPPAPPAPKPKPRCPTCGSENVERLNFVDRGVSFLLVGFASSKVGKSFKCRDCKYTW